MLNSLQNGRCSFIITKLLVHTTTLLISAKNSFLFFTSLFLHTTIPSVTIKIPQKRRDQGAREYCEDWHSSHLSLLPQNMDSDNRAHNYWFLSLRLRKIGVLQVVVYDEDSWNRNVKPSNPPSLKNPNIAITSIPY